MHIQFSRFLLAALSYWAVGTFAEQVITMPAQIINVAIFIPPLLGLMWGTSAALGVYVGAVFVLPEFSSALEGGAAGVFWEMVKNFWVGVAGYLPPLLLHKFNTTKTASPFRLNVNTLKKFIAVLGLTFSATSLLRAVTMSPAEIEILTECLDFGNHFSRGVGFAVYFLNDFFIAIFFDLFFFFLLIKLQYPFYGNAAMSENNEDSQGGINTWKIVAVLYLFFPLGLLFINKYQIYGMDNLATWLHFISECLLFIDIYLAAMLYLLLRYRRSIMLEIVFLVTQTVFLSATIIGGISSLTIGNIANTHAEESLRAMSFICRERLYRTFFLVRQAVNGMTLQAISSIESYERLAGDAEYRKNYLEEMKRIFNFETLGIDGSISYYLRFIPEIEGTSGGFSMQRAEARWEGALAPFLEREPIDLALYDPADVQNVGWFYIPMRTKSATWIEPYVDAITKFYVMSYVSPLFLDGKFIGVVGMDIDFNFIIQELRRMSIYNYGYVYVTNRNNLVLYHRDQPQGTVFRNNPQFQEMEVFLANGMWLGIATPLEKVNAARNQTMMHLIAIVILVALLISLISIAFASRAIKPLAGMTEAAKKIASGDLNVKISYESGNELGILVRSIREMAAKLEVYVYRDKLTGLRNAAAYISKAKELDLQSKIDASLKYGVIIFDANFLKKVNDNYGHEAGNELLRHSASVIQKVFSNSFVYRIGGDEFAAILEGDDYEKRQELLTLFDEELAAEHFQAGTEILSLSVARGLGIYEQGQEFSSVSKKADAAMYNHKLAIKSKLGEEVR